MELFDIESNIEINTIFQRSTRLDSKLSEDYIKNYIFHDTSRSILNRIASSYLKSNQAAFTLTGPYGSGKSSLALFLNALVYDDNKTRCFFNMDDVINYMVENCMFRKLKSGRIKGDFKDNSKKGKRQYFTYEYRGKNHKSHFIGFSGGKGKPFIELLKTKIKYYEDPY